MKQLLFLFLLMVQTLWAGTNVIVITLDTTRADHLSIYGYDRQTTPFIDTLGEKGVVFNDALTSVPSTLPSHTTIFTGLYPFHTKVRHNLRNAVPEDVTTLAQILKRHGYTTGAAIGSLILHKRFGLNRGFDTYNQTMPEGENQRPGHMVTDAALKILKGAKSPFFLWAHYYDPHHPYEPPAPYDKRFALPYDGEIAYMDGEIKRLISSLTPTERQNTLIVLVGDHGEGLGDHKEEEHGILLYQPTMHVPFILNWPGHIKQREVKTAVCIASITPTVLDALGISSKITFNLPSLWPAVKGSPIKPAWLYLETYLPYFSFNWAPLRGVTNGHWKFIEASKEELYYLTQDPAEKENLITKRPEITKLVKKKLASITPEPYGKLVESEQANVPPEELKKLQSLGYLAGGAPTKAAPRTLPDPKDLVDISDEILLKAPALSEKRQYAELETMMRHVLRRDRRNLPAMKFLAVALMGENKLEEAERVLTRADELSPNTYYVLTKLGMVYTKTGRMKKGLTTLEKAYRLNPYNLEVIGPYAQALLTAKQQKKALEVLNVAQKNNLVDGGIMVAWGIYHLQAHEIQTARLDFTKAISLDASSSIAHANLGYVYHLMGEEMKATVEMKKAWKLEPSNRRTLKALIGLLLSTHRRSEARSLMEEYITRFPNAPDATFVKRELQRSH